MTNTSIVLSINPQFTARIFAGTKTVELRRVRPRVSQGDSVFIYESSPTMAVVGYCVVEDLISVPVKDLWHEVRDTAGVSEREFREYYRGAAEGFGIVITGVRRFARPLPLVKLRAVHPGFHPPQSHRYVTSLSDELKRLIRRARARAVACYEQVSIIETAQYGA